MSENEQNLESKSDLDQPTVSDDTSSDEETDKVIPDTSTPEEAKALRAESLKTFGKFSTFGLNLILAVLVGYVIGHFIDGLFGLKYPVFTVFWVLCGVAFAVMELVKMIKQASKLGNNDDTNKPSSP